MFSVNIISKVGTFCNLIQDSSKGLEVIWSNFLTHNFNSVFKIKLIKDQS